MVLMEEKRYNNKKKDDDEEEEKYNNIESCSQDAKSGEGQNAVVKYV